MTQDLTQGKIWKKLLLFTLPLIATNLLQQLYNMVDLIFAGQFLGNNAAAAIGTSSRLILCIINFFSGIAVGSGVSISRYFGAKNLSMARKTMATALVLCLVAGIGFSALAYAVSKPYILLLHTPEALVKEALDYLRIYSLSLISVLAYNMGAAILRAMGDSRRPLAAQMIAGTANVFLDALFTVVIPMGVAGIGLATLLSQGIAAAYVIYRVLKLDFVNYFRDGFPGIDIPILKEIIRIGLPSGTQAFLITFSNVIAQYFINNLSITDITAFTYQNKIDNLIYIPVMSLGQATMTFTAQNFGAGNPNRIRQGIMTAIGGGVAACLIIGFSLPAIGKQLMGIFTTDPETIQSGISIMKWLFPPYFIYIFLQVLGDALRGLGHAKGPMYIVIINMCLLRSVLFAIFVPLYSNLNTVCFIYPITWATTSICMVLLYLRVNKNIDREITNHLSKISAPEI